MSEQQTHKVPHLTLYESLSSTICRSEYEFAITLNISKAQQQKKKRRKRRKKIDASRVLGFVVNVHAVLFNDL